MKSLEQKYIKNQLRTNELDLLRKKVNAMSNDEIEQMMCDNWMNDEIDTSKVDSEDLDKLKKRVDARLGFKSPLYTLTLKIGRIAAIVLLPLLILSTGYFYHQSHSLESQEMLIATGKGERASITLPDGSHVTLNSASQLSYIPQTYNRKERQIKFEGEGHFQISPNKECPFLINARGLNIKVLGTTFNLLVRNDKKEAKLTLEEGRVLLSSIRSGKSVILNSNQQAILNQANGEIIVMKEEAAQSASAWKYGDLIFKNTPLANVIETLQENYGMEIQIDCKECLTDSFTGTITTSDLNEVLDILEKTYHLKAIIKGKVIYLNKEK